MSIIKGYWPRICRFRGDYYGIIALLAFGPLLMGPACQGPSSYHCTEPDDLDSLRQEVLQGVNQQRAEQGLDPVESESTLENVAQTFCCAMVEYDFFPHDHINPNTGEGPGERAEAAGYHFVMLGEDLAQGQQTPAEVVDAWMNSPAHREVILTAEFTEAGVGVCLGNEHGLHWVLEMGRPFDSSVAGKTVAAPAGGPQTSNIDTSK